MKTLAATLVSWGPAGVLLLAIIDSAGIPIPGGVDALVTVVAALGPERGYLSALLATVGSVIGCVILFYIARKGGQRFLDRYTSEGRSARFKEWFLRYGLITVFIPALLPIPLPLKVFVLCAGAFGVNVGSFILVLLAARIPRYFGLAYLGVQLGEHSGAWLKSHSKEILIFALALGLALYILVKLSDRRRRANELGQL